MVILLATKISTRNPYLASCITLKLRAASLSFLRSSHFSSRRIYFLSSQSFQHNNYFSVTQNFYVHNNNCLLLFVFCLLFTVYASLPAWSEHLFGQLQQQMWLRGSLSTSVMAAQKTFVVLIVVVGGVVELIANANAVGTFNYYLLHIIRI